MSQAKVGVVRGVRHRVSLSSEGAMQRRTLDERLYVRCTAAISTLYEGRVIQVRNYLDRSEALAAAGLRE
jgi:hypothetical protein